MKLRSKVFTIFTVLAIVPLVILTLFSYRRYQQITYQRMDDISKNLFENALEQANSTLDDLKKTAGIFTFYSDSNFSIVENLNKFSGIKNSYTSYDEFQFNQDIKFVCQNVLYSNRFLNGMYIFTPSGAVLGHTAGKNGDILTDYDPTATKWYQETLDLNGGIYVSSLDSHPMFSGGKKSVFFAQALLDVYSHKFLGILVLDCSPELFDLSVANTLPDITLLSIDNTQTSCVLYSNIDNLDSNFAQNSRKIMKQELLFSPLRLTAAIDYESMYNEFSLTGMLLLLIAAACAIGIILLAYAISRNLVYPIEHLSRKMANQKGHTLSLTSRYLNRTDEIGTLYNEYNAMVDELNTSVKKDYQDKLVLLDAQMKSLEARINSHFLFNTLESINSMAELSDNEPIATMSLALGNMFRYTIKTQSELVTVEQELSHVTDYVAIQQLRFSNRFHLVVNMPDSLQKQLVLKLILQPLVENALYHGLNYCACGDTITICGREMDNFICIDVSDNGKGISPDQLELLNQKLKEEPSFTELGHRTKQSIGLKNIHSRIELYYGRGYGLTIKSIPDKGTTIKIKLPIVAKEES